MKFWRRRFGADVLVPTFWRQDVSASGGLGAETFWRQDALALTFRRWTSWRQNGLASRHFFRTAELHRLC